ncbi:putative esterase [Phaeosphaeriaceae sp. SRC1lsM3a]|nr:putative esterase [Stagonospora sp. SRC1lsM3a]
MSYDNTKHEALQPIHPSMLDRLDPVFVRLYNENVAKLPMQPINLDVLRTKYSTLYSYGTGPAPEPGRIYNKTITIEGDVSLDIRVYEPATQGPWPVHVDYHGGGWGLGDLDTEAHICKHICVKANVAVIDVAYRLVPEFPFPTALEDSFGALQYIHRNGEAEFNIKPESISVGGVSAGGNIALVMAHLARDARLPLKLICAGTPVIDDLGQYKSAAESPFKSMQENEFAPTLNWQRLAWFDRLKSESIPKDAAEKEAVRQRIGWYLNLLTAPNMKDLAKTVVYTAGCDPLRDEGERYAQLLVENGVEVTLKRFPGVPHPFMHMDKDLWQASQFIDMTSREIRLAHYYDS